jgi:hypothetical protein
MQQEIDAANPHMHVRILGVNRAGLESGNAGITSGRTLPWLQETESQPCWTTWDVTWRDVVILDAQNRRVGVYNLTEHDLLDPENYAALKTMILEEANR